MAKHSDMDCLAECCVYGADVDQDSAFSSQLDFFPQTVTFVDALVQFDYVGAAGSGRLLTPQQSEQVWHSQQQHHHDALQDEEEHFRLRPEQILKKVQESANSLVGDFATNRIEESFSQDGKKEL
jgi:hypothetical protein